MERRDASSSKPTRWEDPRDLFFGLNDLAERVRSLGKDEESQWPVIQSHIDGLIDVLNSFRRPARSREAVTGGSYQSVLLAIEALRIARRAATDHSPGTTADAVQQASFIMRGGEAWLMAAGA